MKTQYISKQFFIKNLVFLIIASPMIFGVTTLILFVVISPFLENRFTAHDSLYLSGIISLFVFILPIWKALIIGYRIDPTGERHKIEHVARIISDPFILSFDEAKLINKVEGWEYKDDKELRLNEEELREAFLLASKNVSIRGAGDDPRTLVVSMLSFITSLIFLVAIKDWRNPAHWPLIGIGILLFFISLYFYKSYKNARRYIKSRNQEVQELYTNEDR